MLGQKSFFVIACIHSNMYFMTPWLFKLYSLLIHWNVRIRTSLILNSSSIICINICHDRYDIRWILIFGPRIFWVYYIVCVASIDTRCYTYVNQDSNPHIWSAKSILKGINAYNNVIHWHVYIAIEFFTSDKVVALKMDEICLVKICYFD